ncbi:MAG: hypothetical protein U0Y68_09680 [Blastocatellia bacterium]
MNASRLKIFTFVFFLLVSCLGQTPSASQTTPVENILQRYEQVLGGEDAVRKISSLTAEGVFALPNIAVQGTIRTYSKAPNKTLAMLRENENGPFLTLGFNGQKAWQQRSADSLIFTREIHGPALAQMRLNAEFYREIKLRELYPKLHWRGQAQIADETADVIAAEAATGSTEKWYFSRSTGLLLCREALALDDTGEGMEPVQSFYADYRAVAGVQIPFESRVVFAQSPERNLILKLQRVTANLVIPDAKFERPLLTNR